MLKKSKNKLKKKEKEKAQNSRFINLTSVAMVIEQEKSIKSTTFEIGKHEKLEIFSYRFLPSAPATTYNFPRNLLSSFLMIYICILSRWPIFFPRTTFCCFFLLLFSIQKYQICGSWICRSDPLVGSPQIWKLFMAQNKKSINHQNRQSCYACANDSFYPWLSMSSSVFVSQLRPPRNPTDLNRLIKFS